MSSVEIQTQSVWVSVLCVLSKQTVGGRTRSEAASCRRISSIVLEAVKCVKRNGYNLSLLKQIVITFFRYHYFCYTRLFSIFKALKNVLKSQETGGGYKQYSPSGKEYFLKRSIPFSGFRLRVYERVGISIVVILGLLNGPIGPTDAFYGCEKNRENVRVLWSIHILKIAH